MTERGSDGDHRIAPSGEVALLPPIKVKRPLIVTHTNTTSFTNEVATQGVVGQQLGRYLSDGTSTAGNGTHNYLIARATTRPSEIVLYPQQYLVVTTD